MPPKGHFIQGRYRQRKISFKGRYFQGTRHPRTNVRGYIDLGRLDTSHAISSSPGTFCYCLIQLLILHHAPSVTALYSFCYCTMHLLLQHGAPSVTAQCTSVTAPCSSMHSALLHHHATFCNYLKRLTLLPHDTSVTAPSSCLGIGNTCPQLLGPYPPPPPTIGGPSPVPPPPPPSGVPPGLVLVRSWSWDYSRTEEGACMAA